MNAIVSAAQAHYRLFRLGDRIGSVIEGKEADIIAVSGDPLSNIELLVEAFNVRTALREVESPKTLCSINTAVNKHDA